MAGSPASSQSDGKVIPDQGGGHKKDDLGSNLAHADMTSPLRTKDPTHLLKKSSKIFYEKGEQKTWN